MPLEDLNTEIAEVLLNVDIIVLYATITWRIKEELIYGIIAND